MAINSASAQKFAGYRGKYFMAGYTVNIGHNLLISQIGTNNDDKLRLHFRHGLHAEYLTNRFTTVGVEADYINTKAGSRISWINDLNNVKDDYRFVSMSAGAYVKEYFGITNGLIAPMGGYGKIKVFVEKMYVQNNADNSKKTYWSPGFGFGYGQSRIIKNAVRLDGAIELNALYGIYSPLLASLKDSEELFDTHGLAFYHLFGYGSTVRIGISGLLF